MDTDSINQNNRLFQNNLDFDYVPQLIEFFNFCADQKIKLTLFVRIDLQIKKEFGLNYLYNNIMCAFYNSKKPIIEWGWHPHFFTDDCQVQKNLSIVKNELQQIYDESDIVRKMSVVRIGACQFNNNIGKLLYDLGFQIDSSGLAGCSRNDEHRFYDWSLIDNRPYYMSSEDYQSSQDCGLFEIPITTVLFKTSYDVSPKRRAINPFYKPEVFLTGVAEFKKISRCVIACHAEELLSGYQDDLYCYGIENFKHNFSFLDSPFVTISEICRE